MGYLAAAGAYLIIGLVVSFILMVVGLFIGHIIVFDSIALGIISGVCCNHFFTLHPALCVLIGAAVFALLLFLQNTRFGFWVIGVLLSAAWAVIFWAAGVYYLQCRSTLVLCGLRACFYRHAAAPYQGKR